MFNNFLPLKKIFWKNITLMKCWAQPQFEVKRRGWSLGGCSLRDNMEVIKIFYFCFTYSKRTTNTSSVVPKVGHLLDDGPKMKKMSNFYLAHDYKGQYSIYTAYTWRTKMPFTCYLPNKLCNEMGPIPKKGFKSFIFGCKFT